jgi:hypothetical protein
LGNQFGAPLDWRRPFNKSVGAAACGANTVWGSPNDLGVQALSSFLCVGVTLLHDAHAYTVTSLVCITTDYHHARVYLRRARALSASL